jgi:hypothetical protein
VTDEENKLLVEPFSEEEVKHVLFQMEHNKASGPDRFRLNSTKLTGR